MAKKDETALAPRLRFPGFEKPWSNAPLSETLVEHKLKNTSGRDVFSVSMESGIVNQVEHLGRSFAASDTAHYNLARRFEVVYTKSPLKAFPFGIVKQCKFDGEVAVSPLYGVFTPDNPHVGLMIEAYFESPSRSQAFLAPLCQKGAKNTIQVTNARFLSGRLPLPLEPAEQRQIADCLASLDEVIAAQGRKVQALKTYKRGLMQQLFPREGDTLPRLRFPEFRDGPEWKAVKAGSLFANRSERGDDSLPIYSVTMTDGLVKRTSLDRRIDDLAEATGNKKAYRYDIAYNMMRMWQGACGVAGEECMVSPAYVVLSPQSGVHSPFYGYLFKLQQMLRLFTSHSRGLTEDRLRLYYQDFSGIPLPQPDVREQEQIANCLLALDARIAMESVKMDALKDHKKGLMQLLFPVPDEA